MYGYTKNIAEAGGKLCDLVLLEVKSVVRHVVRVPKSRRVPGG